MKPPFEILEHPSDIGIEANGGSTEEVFRNAAIGLITIIAGSSKLQSSEERPVSIPAMDLENLMVKWLSELLFLFETEKFLTSDVEFGSLNNNSLKATLRGEIYDPLKHELNIDVKAVTYHKLKVGEKNGRWNARIFLDI